MYEQVVTATEAAPSTFARAWLALNAGDADLATECIDNYQSDEETTARPLRFGRAQEVRFRLAMQLGNPSMAHDVAHRTLETFEEWPNMRWRWLTFRGHAASLAGNTSDSERDFAEARSALDAIMINIRDTALANAYSSTDVALTLLHGEELNVGKRQ